MGIVELGAFLVDTTFCELGIKLAGGYLCSYGHIPIPTPDLRKQLDKKGIKWTNGSLERYMHHCQADFLGCKGGDLLNAADTRINPERLRSALEAALAIR